VLEKKMSRVSYASFKPAVLANRSTTGWHHVLEKTLVFAGKRFLMALWEGDSGLQEVFVACQLFQSPQGLGTDVVFDSFGVHGGSALVDPDGKQEPVDNLICYNFEQTQM
jgi:hypothetical protein